MRTKTRRVIWTVELVLVLLLGAGVGLAESMAAALAQKAPSAPLEPVVIFNNCAEQFDFDGVLLQAHALCGVVRNTHLAFNVVRGSSGPVGHRVIKTEEILLIRIHADEGGRLEVILKSGERLVATWVTDALAVRLASDDEVVIRTDQVELIVFRFRDQLPPPLEKVFSEVGTQIKDKFTRIIRQKADVVAFTNGGLFTGSVATLEFTIKTATDTRTFPKESIARIIRGAPGQEDQIILRARGRDGKPQVEQGRLQTTQLDFQLFGDSQRKITVAIAKVSQVVMADPTIGGRPPKKGPPPQLCEENSCGDDDPK